MRTFARVLLTLALGTACSPPPTMPGTCQPARGGDPAIPPLNDLTFGVAGDVLTVTMRVTQYCPTDIAVRASVSAQDPGNQPVPLAEGDNNRDVTDRSADFGMSTQVKVLPKQPGAYHFTARFEPNLGLVQTDILVAENHRSDVPALTPRATPGLGACTQIDVSPGGRPLCLAGDVSVYAADGARLQQLAPTAVAARAGSVLWTYQWGLLQRWRETDAGFVAEPAEDAGLALDQAAAVLLPTENDLITVSQGDPRYVSFADAGLSWRRLPGFANLPVAAWRSQDLFMGMDGQQLCTATLTDGGGPCTFVAGTSRPMPVASDSHGIWRVNDTAISAGGVFGHALGLFKPTNIFNLNLPDGWDVPDAGEFVEWNTSPALTDVTGECFVVGEQRNEFVLQRFAEGKPLLNATGEWASFRDGDRVLIYKR